MEYHGKVSICRGTTGEEEFEKVFAPSKRPRKNSSSSWHEIVMKDLIKDSTINFNLWSLGENIIRELKNGKDISKLIEDVEIIVLSDGEEEEAIDDKGPIVT